MGIQNEGLAYELNSRKRVYVEGFTMVKYSC